MALLGRSARWLVPAAALVLTPVGQVLPGDEARDIFPHRVHVKDQGLSCQTCHRVSDRPEKESPAPSPQSCQDCHEPRDVARFFPVGAYHSPGFINRHQLQTRSAQDRCTVCHEGSETCLVCHQGENLDLLAHPRNYLFMHSEQARHGEVECSGCHRAADFCTPCHAAERVRPGSHGVAGWSRGGVHGAEARRDAGYCAACHSEEQPVCLSCHRER